MVKTPLRNYGEPVGSGQCRHCGKIEYASKADAKAAIRQLPRRNGRLHAYRCPVSHWWHVGHMPYLVARGVKPRSEV